MKPSLATPLPSTEVERFIADQGWGVEPKLDGQRLVVDIHDREARFYGRNGKELRAPEEMARIYDNPGFEGHWTLDGELVGDTYWVFDMPQSPVGGPTLALRDRHANLTQLMSAWNVASVRHVPLSVTTTEKALMLQRIAESSMEGVVFKSLASSYCEGRGLHWRKHKFTETADCVVSEVERKGKAQAISIQLLGPDGPVDVGGCKIPEWTVGTLAVGDVVEIRYLYATNELKLYQPCFLRRRTDKEPYECTTDQLKIGVKYV